MFSLFCLPWYKVVSFLLLFNNQISRAGNYYPFILELIVTLTFLHKEWRKKKKINPNPQTTVFILEKSKKKFFFFFMKGTEKNKRERETIANKCFVIHNCMLFAVVMVIIQLCVVSPVSSCLCILWVSFCLLLLWLF